MGATRSLALPAALVGERQSRARALALTPWWSVALAVPLLAGTAVKLALDSRHLAHPGLAAAYRTCLIAVPMLIGLAWWRRRPASRHGPLLILLGLAGVPLALESSNTPVLVALGGLGEAVYFSLCVYLFVAFPGGRLRPAAERWLVAAFGLGTALFYVPALLFLPGLRDTSAMLATCAPACPANPLHVASLPGVVGVACDAAAVLSGIATAGLGGVFLSRVRHATEPQRREVTRRDRLSLVPGARGAVRRVARRGAGIDADDARPALHRGAHGLHRRVPRRARAGGAVRRGRPAPPADRARRPSGRGAMARRGRCGA